MQRRVLAALGAVAIVIIAVVARGLIDGGDDDPGSGPGPRGDVLVVCDLEFEEQCGAMDGVEVHLEDSAVTSAAIVSGDTGAVEAWVTTDAWFEVTAARVERGAGTAQTIASTPIVVAVDPGRAEALTALCEGKSAWACLVDNAGKPWADLGGSAGWGQLKVGLPDADTATGLSVLASVAAGHFGNPDFASNEFDQLRPRLAALTEPSGKGDADPLFTLVRRLGTYSAAGVLQSRAEALTTPPPLFPDDSGVAATAVLVNLPGSDDEPDVDALKDAFAAAGWTTGAGEPARLFKPGVLGALHELWKGVTS